MTGPLQEMQARMAIADVITRYGNCLDRGDFDGLRALFAEDAVFHFNPDPGIDSPVHGIESILEAIGSRWQVMNDVEQRRHVMSNIEVVELAEVSARARTTLIVLAVERTAGSPIRLHGLGVYDDRLERRTDSWVFRERRVDLDRRDYFAPGWVSSR